NNTAVTIPAAPLSDFVAQQAQKTPEASALADAHYHFTYREMREQVVAPAYALRERGVQPGGSVAGGVAGCGFLSLAAPWIFE
ncbi:AMP-binding protein, partial [Salmonella enterica]|uniref:AMP-binding protein n=1 Tax=Salmonella enterica TaxID=28901 RepID=UPI000A4A5632